MLRTGLRISTRVPAGGFPWTGTWYLRASKQPRGPQQFRWMRYLLDIDLEEDLEDYDPPPGQNDA